MQIVYSTMNIKEYVGLSGDDNCGNDTCDSVFSLITELSKHIVRTHQILHRKNIYYSYENDTKTIKRLRSKAFEILLRKRINPVPEQNYEEFLETDPFVEIQKHAFALKFRSKQSHNATTLEDYLQKIENISNHDLPVLPVLQLLVQLKSFDIKPKPIMDIFYCDRTNPAIPEIGRTVNQIPPFQIYPMECFLLSDIFEATLETRSFQITSNAPVTLKKEINFLYSSIKPKAILELETTDVSVAHSFMSSHAFEKVSSHTLLHPIQEFTPSSGLNLYISQNNMPLSYITVQQEFATQDKYSVHPSDYSFIEQECEQIISFPQEKPFDSNCLCLPVVQTNVDENESITNIWKCFGYNATCESNQLLDICNCTISQSNLCTDVPFFDRQAWEYFGETQSTKELMFITETLAAAIHLEKIKHMNHLPVLSDEIMNPILSLKKLSTKMFISDVKSLLLGIESESFGYTYMLGFVLRKNIRVNSICLQSLEKTCQEAINWGNCFKFLTDLVASKSLNSTLPQEGLIFKAMCTNIKELLLYYQAVLLRIFTQETEVERLLKLFEDVRPVATLIVRVARICEPYKVRNQYTCREEGSILTRIYNEAIKVTDTKAAFVFYSLLKSCCEVYFRFLQKWIFEGVCDDVYGEFMIKTRPLYLRNRSHKFWTKSFSICNEAVPGFLSDLADSILQCGKTVMLLRTCDSKNPVCRTCVTEQPEIKVCLSVISLHDQLLRCQEYERKGNAALGSVLSLSTAILNDKRLVKPVSDVTVNTERDFTTHWRTHEGRGYIVKILKEPKQNIQENTQQQGSVSNLQQTSKTEIELQTRAQSQIEYRTNENTIREEAQQIERANILNYYDNLACDINTRRIRSQWRIKRMKFYNKRADVLATVIHDINDEQIKIPSESNCTMQFNTSVKPPLSIEDENKNYTETSDRTLMSVMMTPSRTISEEDSITSQRSNNNSSAHNLQYIQEIEILNRKTLLVNKDTANTQLNDILENVPVHCVDRSSTIERPTFLNVTKMDNLSKQSEINGMHIQPLEYNMTPNNNEIATEQIEFNMNQAKRTTSMNCIESTTSLNRGFNLETPLSYTTDDNFTSSMESPISQMYNLEDSDPAETETLPVPNSSHLTSRSSIPIKKDSTFSDLFELARDEATLNNVSPVADKPLSITDVEILDHISLQTYLEKSIRIPLRVQSRLINNAVIKYFLKEKNLLLHLHSLRSYFFLLNGEFAKSLTDSLYARLYKISIPTELFNSATLMNLLKRALINSFSSAYINSELLSLSATDTPSELHISDPTALDCLALNYKIIWPLNIILDHTVMQQYGKVFKFLITSGRVSWVLQEDFNIMKRERNAITSEQYHKLQLYRHAMTQFMNALHNYLTCSVLYASWTEFEKDLENSITVDHIYLSHINYIKRILSRCMLNNRGEKVRTCLNNIFKVILKFHNRIGAQSWIKKPTGYVHPNFKKLEQMYRAFCELRAYMAHVAFKLATSGYQPHLMHFLNALNINQAYDLTTVKPCRSTVGPQEPC